MEALVKASRRKKRKTRRSLNEIKKRCDHAMNSVVSKMQCIPRNMPFKHITSQRLTLLNNVIRSKTVLRGHVLNSDNMYVNHKCNKTKSHKWKIKLQNDSLKKYTECSKSETDEFNVSEVEAQRVKSIDSIFLSSTSSKEPSPSVKVPLSSHFQRSSDLYEEFVNNIPIFFKESLPQLRVESDVMKNNKLTLHRIKLDMRVENKNNFFGIKYYAIPTEKETVNKKLVGSPKIAVSSESQWQFDLETASNSSKSNLSDLSRPQSTCFNNAIYLQKFHHDSPEHQYYPHKLNQ